MAENGNQNRRTRLNKHLQRVNRTCDVFDPVWVILHDHVEESKNKMIIVFNSMTRQSDFMHPIICSINWMHSPVSSKTHSQSNLTDVFARI